MIVYCDFGEQSSDVYVWADGKKIYCAGCLLNKGDTVTGDVAGMIGHLTAHRETGHTVPEKVFARLEREMEGQNEPLG